MRIFLSNKQPDDQSVSWINNLAALNSNVLNAEATYIVCDNFISTFPLEELSQLLSIISSKMRMGCELIINDVDSDLLFKRAHTEEINIEEVNAAIFKDQNRKSIFSIGVIQKLLPNTLTITHKHYDYNNCLFTLKCRRAK